MAKVSYQPLGPLLSSDGSRAFLGLEIAEGAPMRPVVLVWVPEEIAQDPELAAKVARENKRAMALVHPNVIKVYGLATLDEGLARIVEFADGEPLRKVLELVKKLPPRLAALVAADAAMGVHYAHVAGHEDGTPFLHGDLRPETLMVSFSGVCKVGGYGALGVAPKEPGGRRLPGRRSHCAPEQIVGGREALNRQTDVYLLGLVLYECLTGQIPFKDDPQFDDAVVNRPFPLLLPEDVPPPLIRVVEQATAKKAYDRFPTARALRDAIERAVGVLPAHEELEIFLRRFFPNDSPARVARRREIEAGIAELSRREAQSAPLDRPSEAEAPPIAHAAKARSLPLYASSLLLLPLVFLGLWYASQTGPAGEFTSSPEKIVTRAGEEPRGKSGPRQQAPQAIEERAKNAPEPSSGSQDPLLAEQRTGASAEAPGTLAAEANEPAASAQTAVAQAVAGASASAEAPAALAAKAKEPTTATQPAVAVGGVSTSAEAPAALAAEAKEPTTATQPAVAVGGVSTSTEAPVALPARANEAATSIQPAVAKPPAADVSPSALNASLTDGTASLELTVDPPVDVTIDGRPAGRSPITVAVSPGKHTVQFSDPGRGINVSRSIRVAANAKTAHRLVIGKGTVEVSAPDGAAIFIDGKAVGTAPLGEIPVFEGKHRILATFGGAKWQQGFAVGANERMSFKIETVEQ